MFSYLPPSTSSSLQSYPDSHLTDRCLSSSGCPCLTGISFVTPLRIRPPALGGVLDPSFPARALKSGSPYLVVCPHCCTTWPSSSPNSHLAVLSHGIHRDTSVLPYQGKCLPSVRAPHCSSHALNCSCHYSYPPVQMGGLCLFWCLPAVQIRGLIVSGPCTQ